MTGAGLVARVVPQVALGGRRAVHLLERNVLVARQIWLIIVSGFFESVVYLFGVGVGVGVGALIGDVTGPGGRVVEYAAFVAPALLGAAAMNGAVFESTNIYFKLKWAKIYDAVVATPLNPGDIAIAEIAWSLIRGGIYAMGFLLVMSLFGYMPSAWGWLALPPSRLRCWSASRSQPWAWQRSPTFELGKIST